MFLGVDIGTSAVKAIVLDESGAVVAQQSAALTVQRPQPGWSEQDPEAWWRATDSAVRAIDPTLRRGVRGIGLAGQMHGATLLDKSDRPLRAAILWNDGRSFAQCQTMLDRAPDLHAIAGNLAMPGFTAPKLIWVQQHEPRVFDDVATVLLPKDYIRLRMTGDKASDLSDSAGTLWLDVAARRWSEALLDACDLGVQHMPRLYEGSEITGRLRPELAVHWDMEAVPVAAGGGDNASGAIGVGVVDDGDALLSLGTSGVIFVATDVFRPNPARAVHAFCHALPNLWHQMSVHLSAAVCVDWVARLIGVNSVADLFALAEQVGPASGPEIFMPYLSGERTPHNDAEVRGAFHQLDHDTNPARLAQAVLEGIAFALADGLAVLREAGTTVDRLSVIGGGARSFYWGRILASAMNVRLDYLEGGEIGPALGAARLAQLAVDKGELARVCFKPGLRHSVSPDPALITALRVKQRKFIEAYPRIAPRNEMS